MVANMGQDRPDQQWILTDFDTWEKNPCYMGPDQPHPEDDRPDLGDDSRMYPGEDMELAAALFDRQFTEWQGDSREGGVGCD